MTGMKSNLMNYLREYRNKSFKEHPFSEVDALLLSTLSYLKMDGIVPGFERGGTIGFAELLSYPAAEHLFSDPVYGEDYRKIIALMSGSRRYGKLRFGYFTQYHDADRETQFAAVTFFLGVTSVFLSFRGTDETLVGWKEDFNLSTGVVPAQERAVEYMQRISDKAYGMLRVGGHSKGGNLAIYGSVMCKSAHDKILEIYSNDGPGFSKEFQEFPETAEMMPKIIRIIPEYSIIGTLLEHEKQPIIVASTSRGLLQHDGFSWEVQGPGLVRRDSLNKTALRFIEILHKWIDGMDMEQKRLLIEDLFATLQASGYENLSEVQSGGLKSLAAMVKRLDKFAPESRGMMQELLTAICGGWLEQLQENTKDKLSAIPQSFSDKILEKF